MGMSASPSLAISAIYVFFWELTNCDVAGPPSPRLDIKHVSGATVDRVPSRPFRAQIKSASLAATRLAVICHKFGQVPAVKTRTPRRPPFINHRPPCHVHMLELASARMSVVAPSASTSQMESDGERGALKHQGFLVHLFQSRQGTQPYLIQIGHPRKNVPECSSQCTMRMACFAAPGAPRSTHQCVNVTDV